MYAVDLHVKNKGKIVTQIIFDKSLEMWAIVRFVENDLDVSASPLCHLNLAVCVYASASVQKS